MGSDGVLASVAWASIVTVWNTTTGTIEQLHCFSSGSFHFLDTSSSGPNRVSNVQVVDRSKVVILVKYLVYLGGLFDMFLYETDWQEISLET